MQSNAKSKWKALSLPDQAAFLCSSIEVLHDYKELKRLKRKTGDDNKDDITIDKQSAAKKKKKNKFEISNQNEGEIDNLKEGKVVKSSLAKCKEVVNEGKDKKDGVKHDNGIGKIEKKKTKKNKKKIKNDKPTINIDAFNLVLNKSGKQEDDKSSLDEDKKKKGEMVASDGKKDKAVIVSTENDCVNDDAIKFDAVADMSEWKSLYVCDEILLALKAKGFTKPTPIQKLTLPMALKGRRDIVGAAETGSGKTLAFCIPIIQGILRDRKREENGEEFEDDIEKKNNDKIDDLDNENDVELDDLDNEDDMGDQDDIEDPEEKSDDDIEIKNDDELDDVSDKDDLEDPDDKSDDKIDIDGDERVTDDDEDEIDYRIKERIGKTFQKEKKEKVSKLDKFRINLGKQTELPALEETMPDFEDNQIQKGANKLRALILTPTRELAVQIKNHIQDILKITNVTIAVIVGGMSAEKQLRLLRRCPDIVVGTPGRLWELYQEGNPHLFKLPNINYLAIDETDRMGEKGHFLELGSILEAVARGGTHKQRFVMSATLSLVHKAPLYKKGIKKPRALTTKQKLTELMVFAGVGARKKIVDLTSGASTAQSLSESAILCDTMQKDLYVYYFIKTHKGRTIVFCNSIDCVRRVAKTFEYLDVTPLPLHAQMHQKQRLKNLERFVERDDGLLIATDVAARGLDIPNIDHVIHYQVPRTCETYIHRSGRTARANKSGLSVLLIDLSEKFLYNKIRTTLQREKDLPLFPVDETKFNGLSKRMELAKRLDLLVHREKKKRDVYGWMAKAAEEADILISDDEEDDERAIRKSQDKNMLKDIARTRNELKALLRKPVYSILPLKYPSELLNSLGASGIQTTTTLVTEVGTVTARPADGGASAIHALKQDLQQQINAKRDLTKIRNKKRGNRPRNKNQKV